MHQCAWIQVSRRRGSIISIANSHRPWETNFWNEVVEHDGKNNTAQAGASCDDTVRKASSHAEPGSDAIDGRREEAADSNWATNSLRKEDLIVFGREGSHHETENVHEGAEEKNVSWTKSIVDSPNDETLWMLV